MMPALVQSSIDSGQSASGELMETKKANSHWMGVGLWNDHSALHYAWKDSPQPQVLLTLGLLNLNPEPVRASTQSISVPSRYMELPRSTKTLKPPISRTSSPLFSCFSNPMWYW